MSPITTAGNADVGFASYRYQRHQPEKTLLYQLVSSYYSVFTKYLAREGKLLPNYVQREFEAYLKCGRLEHGFLRVRCENCYEERLVAFSCKRRGIAHMFFQRMQTPGDLEKKELIVDDLPYAGLIAWQGTLYAWDDQVTDQFSLYLGAVGPVTLAEETQSLIHDLTHAQEPMGWDNQIENEPVFKIEAQRVWNLYRSNRKGKEIDILGLWGQESEIWNRQPKRAWR
jgi:hypothetical protein